MIPCVNNRSMECPLPLYIKTETPVVRIIFNRSQQNFHRRILGSARNTLPVGITPNSVSSLILGGFVCYTQHQPHDATAPASFSSSG